MISLKDIRQWISDLGLQRMNGSTSASWTISSRSRSACMSGRAVGRL